MNPLARHGAVDAECPVEQPHQKWAIRCRHHQGSAQASGAELFTDCPVERITTATDGRASGVVLTDGQEINAKLVLSNATPEVTFNK